MFEAQQGAPTTYTVTVNSGDGDGDYVENATVTITADNPPQGKVFDKWEVTGATVADVNSASTTFNMPANDVTATATYKEAPSQTYTVTVVNGTGGGNYAEGANVTITANSPAQGKEFDKWVVTGATVANETSTTTSFTMPAGNVIAEATYKDISNPNPTTPSTSSGSSYYGDLKDFWDEVEEDIEDAEKGETVEAPLEDGIDKLPWYIINALRDNPDVGLSITKNGKVIVNIPAGKAIANEPGRVYYSFNTLKDLYGAYLTQYVAEKNPDTGDTTHMMGGLGVMILASLGIIVLGKKKF